MDRKVLEVEFEEMGLTISNDTIDECFIACISNQISAEDLVGSWIAHCASCQIDPNDLSKERLSALVKSLQNDKYISDKKRSVEQLSSTNLNLSNTVNIPEPLDITSNTSINLENQISVNKIIEAHDEIVESTSSSGDIACEFGHVNVNTTYPSVDVETLCLLNQKLWDRFVYGQVDKQKFNVHFQNLAEDIRKKYGLKPITPFSDLILGNNAEEITIAGSLKRIKKELYLCSMHGRIKLDLIEAVQPINQLFTNQIVVVIGTHQAYKVFQVKQLFTEASLPLSNTLPKLQGNLNVLVAAGPFFNEASPNGKPLKSLVQKAIELKTKLLILLGPVFDMDFGTQLNKTSTENLQKCYDEILESILKPLFDNPSTQNIKILILSSWKDGGPFAFYPTPPSTESQLPVLYPDNIFMVSDPSLFSANDVIIACNACDSLMGLHVSAMNQTKGEMFTKLVKQIVGQRCLHPSCTTNPAVPVDHGLWVDHCSLHENRPHLILTSSQLRTFIRTVDNCMVINVGQLVKHNSQKQTVSGTYGIIQISPAKNHEWSPETNVFAKIIHL